MPPGGREAGIEVGLRCVVLRDDPVIVEAVLEAAAEEFGRVDTASDVVGAVVDAGCAVEETTSTGVVVDIAEGAFATEDASCLRRGLWCSDPATHDASIAHAATTEATLMLAAVLKGSSVVCRGV